MADTVPVTTPEAVAAAAKERLLSEEKRHADQIQLERDRMENTKLSMRMEAIRLAKDILVENARVKPVDERNITAEQITTFADTIMTSVQK
jgi:hypothetical protein